MVWYDRGFWTFLRNCAAKEGVKISNVFLLGMESTKNESEPYIQTRYIWAQSGHGQDEVSPSFYACVIPTYDHIAVQGRFFNNSVTHPPMFQSWVVAHVLRPYSQAPSGLAYFRVIWANLVVGCSPTLAN